VATKRILCRLPECDPTAPGGEKPVEVLEKGLKRWGW
jgi:hypothetical protein